MNSVPSRDTHRTFAVIWQDPDTREFVRVGTLAERGDAGYRFGYHSDLPAQFEPFPAFPDTSRTYESTGLFPLFLNRVMSSRRADFLSHLSALGLESGQAEPLEILTRSTGERATDTLHIVQDPTEDADGNETMLFLVSGVRHRPRAGERVARLQPGEQLELRPEPANEFDDQAVMLLTVDGVHVGYVPGYLAGYVHSRLDNADVRVTVEHANGADVAWHLRLLCRLDVIRVDEDRNGRSGDHEQPARDDRGPLNGDVATGTRDVRNPAATRIRQPARAFSSSNGLMRPRRLQPTS